MNKENIKFTIMVASICLVVIGLIVIPAKLIDYGNQYTEHEYQLYEMNEGVYAIYYTTHSSVPAYNYEVVTLCCDGNIYTFKGNVYISFTNDEPYAKVIKYNTVNNDDVYVYVPYRTVCYRSSVNVGS